MIHAVGLAIVLGVASQGPSAPLGAGPPVRIAAASDLRFALDEIVTAFRALHPNTLVEPVYGSSGNFFAQIREGAPFDIFLSADSEYAQRLHGEGIGGRPFNYAIGRLALVVRKESGLDPKGLGDLLRSPAIRRLAIANPAHAPYGRAAEAALRTWRIYDLVAPRLVRGDSVSQAAQFIDTGNAQAALVALSLVKGKSDGLVFAEVPESAHPPLDQAGLILKRTTAPEAARAFQAFLTGEAGRGILARYGFGLPARP
jgi:molybdate transport system substrate-binding protein